MQWAKEKRGVGDEKGILTPVMLQRELCKAYFHGIVTVEETRVGNHNSKSVTPYTHMQASMKRL